MKIVENEFRREIDASASVVLWNYWDPEHLYVVHKNYTSAYVIFEDERMAVYLLTFKLPVFSFLRSDSLNVMVQHDTETIKVYNVGLFGIPSVSTVTVKETRKDHCELTMNYKFILRGWTCILAPLFQRMTKVWNERVWFEDLPLKERRQKVIRLGFKDFIGLPDKIEDRFYEGNIPFQLPVKRHKRSPVNLDI